MSRDPLAADQPEEPRESPRGLSRAEALVNSLWSLREVWSLEDLGFLLDIIDVVIPAICEQIAQDIEARHSQWFGEKTPHVTSDAYQDAARIARGGKP